jgi:hypothetical protein
MQVTQTLRSLEADRLDGTYPIAVGPDITLRTDVMLVHLATHASYHLGQIDYHRRIVTGDATTLGTLAMPPLVAPLPEAPELPADA